MEDFKLNNFKSENPEKELRFITLSIEDSKWVIKDFLNLLNVEKISFETSYLYKLLFAKLCSEILYNNEITADKISEIVRNLSIPDNALCFIYWDEESKVDLFKCIELVNYWEYIWYDTGDEAMILYFPSVGKVILITDHGVIKSN